MKSKLKYLAWISLQLNATVMAWVERFRQRWVGRGSVGNIAFYEYVILTFALVNCVFQFN